MKIRSERISASIAKAILRRYGKSNRNVLRAVFSFFSLFKLFLARYRPMDFLALRHEAWGLEEDEYADSFQAKEDEEAPPPQESSRRKSKSTSTRAIAKLVPIGDLGYSGSTFFMTPNGKFLIKSLPRRFEYEFFRKELLGPYIAHMRDQPHSLLVRITDLVYAPYLSLGGVLGTAPTHHIIMENLLYGKDAAGEAAGESSSSSGGSKWESYDLKPNDYFVPERDIANGRLVPDSVKDKLADEFPDKACVPHDDKTELMALLEADTALLANHNAVDYSLFLVRFPSPGPMRPARESPIPVLKSNAGRWRSGVNDVDGRWTYRVAVLDFFWAKHTLRARTMTGIVKAFNKVAHRGPMTITADPGDYRQRFLSMVDDMVLGM